MKSLIYFLFFSIPLFLKAQSCVTISDGTYGNSQTSPLSPIYGLYNYSWSSNIYYPADIGAAKTITTLAWYVDEFQSGYSQTGPYTFNNVQIYFAYTTLSGWAGTSNVSGLNRLTGVNVAQGITSWTKVFDGSITFDASNAYETVTLTTAFNYDGVTNLVVHVDNNDGTWASGYPYFHYTNTTSTGFRTMKYGAQDASMGPTTGTRYYARADIRFCTALVLPVELSYFNPYYEDGKVKIKWATESERDNDYFTIEKSIDGDRIESIDTIAAVGNSVGLVEYQTQDSKLNSTINYYRLKQVDLNGDFTYSEWRSVLIDKQISDLIVYPIPTEDNIFINFVSEADAEKNIYITDLMGKIIYEKNLTVTNGFNNFTINLNEFKPGPYLLNFDKVVFKIEIK